MNPIIDPNTLTEEQREVLRRRYHNIYDDYERVDACVRYELRYIFGENFFKKGE